MKHKIVEKVKILDCGTTKELETEMNKAIKEGWVVEEYWRECDNQFFQGFYAMCSKYKGDGKNGIK